MIDASISAKPTSFITKSWRWRHPESGYGRAGSSQGQILVEFVLVLPLLLLIGLGIIEFSLFLHDQHVVSRLTREGSNLISRSVTLYTAGVNMRSMVNPPVNLNTANSKLIFSVITRLNASGQANNNQVILYQRYEIGSLAASSRFATQGTFSTGGAPDYYTINPASNTNLRIRSIPSSLVINSGQFVYITEIFATHTLITPFKNFGVTLPSTLYSVAYF